MVNHEEIASSRGGRGINGDFFYDSRTAVDSQSELVVEKPLFILTNCAHLYNITMILLYFLHSFTCNLDMCVCVCVALCGIEFICGGDLCGYLCIQPLSQMHLEVGTWVKIDRWNKATYKDRM